MDDGTKKKTALRAYFKFLNLVDGIKRNQPALDNVEEILLNQITAAWNHSAPLTVTSAMKTVEALAPATVHRRIQTLRSKGMVELETDAHDSRIKYLAPTHLALQYFEALNECLELSMKK